MDSLRGSIPARAAPSCMLLPLESCTHIPRPPPSRMTLIGGAASDYTSPRVCGCRWTDWTTPPRLFCFPLDLSGLLHPGYCWTEPRVLREERFSRRQDTGSDPLRGHNVVGAVRGARHQNLPCCGARICVRLLPRGAVCAPHCAASDVPAAIVENPAATQQLTASAAATSAQPPAGCNIDLGV